ncbi:MAG: Uma2 family endonuclease [Pirellulales bacterium]
MSTMLANAPITTIMPVLTAADLALFPTDLPSGPVDYELNNGRLIIMMVPGFAHAKIQNRLGTELHMQGERLGLGVALTEVGVILWRNPDRVVGPDVAFVSRALLPPALSPEGYLETIPELIVEVRSKNESLAELGGKVADYLKAGVRLAIVVDPETKTAALHRPEQPIVVLAEADTLTCDDIIPGFRLPLGNLFADLPPATAAN